MNNEMRITVLPEGPYMVSGSVPLVVMAIVRNAQREAVGWKQLKELPLQETYALCRCGHSKNKPFCDGAHVAAGFTGTETATNEPFDQGAERIEGEGVTLYDNQKFCVGAEFCDRLGGIWNLVRVTEETSGAANSEEATEFVQEAQKAATEQACHCPSGRLVMHKRLADGTDLVIEPEYETPSIALIEDPGYGLSGALWIRGGIPVYGANGNPYEVRNRMTLCRCGASRNKPFCDGGHYAIKFIDELNLKKG